MPRLDISSATVGDMDNTVTDFTVSAMNTDGATGTEEFVWVNPRWAEFWGYFNTIPELKSAIIMKAIWNVGKGYTADTGTKVILEHITGWGKDTFSDILFNMEVIKRIGGDAFAEIIRDKYSGTIINLKVLDPSSVRIVVDKKGILLRYEQINKVTRAIVKWQPNEILHLANNRLADQVHGISDIISMEEIIKAEAENFSDMKKIMHRQARPLIMFKLKTDDTGKIAQFISKMETALNKGDNLYIPDDENTVSYEVVQVDVASVVMAWRDDIRNKFYRAVGLPQIVFGSSGTTESGGKIEYLAHEQVFARSQKEIEEQYWQQMQVRIKLIPPTTLLENLQQDETKDAQNSLTLQRNDVTAGSGE